MFPPSRFVATAAILATVNFASGHIIMNTPEPYDIATVSTSPLGVGQFPCQGGKGIGSITTLQAGGLQVVKFTGSAVHGGGSCQFSVNYNYDPTNNKTEDWKTIYTIIGGCPAETVGNLNTVGTDPYQRPDGPKCGNSVGKDCLRQFDVPIPKGLKNGNATFAWTWFNAVGKREMYMNCAPVSITGGADDDTFTNSLPSIFAANIGSDDGDQKLKVPCLTDDGILSIPAANAGQFGIINDAPNSVHSDEATCPIYPVPVFGSSNGTQPQPPPASSAAGTATPSSSASVAASSSAAGATTLQTVTTPAAAPSFSAPKPPTGEGTSAAPPPPASSPPGSQACSPNGAIICMGAGHFGICDHGYAVPQALAAGTTCSNGQISRRSAFRSRQF